MNKKIIKFIKRAAIAIASLFTILALTSGYFYWLIPHAEIALYKPTVTKYTYNGDHYEIPTSGPQLTKTLVPADAKDALQQSKTLRENISLNGEWQIEQGGLEQQPKTFGRTIVVPGVIDMAVPSFKIREFNMAPGEEGSIERIMGIASYSYPKLTDEHREAFWYKRTFTVEDEIPATALLTIHKARYHSKVWLNDIEVGEHNHNFTAGVFDVAQALKGSGEENTLIVRINAVPSKAFAHGIGIEQLKFLPGIYDDVELTLSGEVFVDNIQIVPDIKKSQARIVAWVKNRTNHEREVPLHFVATQYQSDTIVGAVTVASVMLKPNETKLVDVIVPISDMQLWSTDNPHLYQMHVSSGQDTFSTRFGMRDFRFDSVTKKPMLNGQPHYLRGTNVPFYRFLEDPQRGDKGWDENWIRKLFQSYKNDMNWDFLRFHIGPVPRVWYKIADEEGIMIQDEYALWYLFKSVDVPMENLVEEYVRWMETSWNYPSIIIWDAQNETAEFNVTTLAALRKVRHLDLSDRPWDNGWGEPDRPTDPFEHHEYPFHMANVLGGANAVPFDMAEWNDKDPYFDATAIEPNPILVNEFSWLWLTRDGDPTFLTEKVYKDFPELNTKVKRLEFQARTTAAMTEVLRAERQPGVMFFPGLSGCHDTAATCDKMTDLNTLEWEPNFVRFVGDAYAQVGLAIYNFTKQRKLGEETELSVVVYNDSSTTWNGPVTLQIEGNDNVVTRFGEQQVSLEPSEKTVLTFNVKYPETAGNYELVALITGVGGDEITSRRLFKVK
jgi:hypothetical protein